MNGGEIPQGWQDWLTSRRAGKKRTEFLPDRPAHVRPLPGKKSLVDQALANLNSWSLHDEARLRGALSFIPPNIDGQTWYALAGALFDLEWIIEDVDIGLELFNDYSARSEGVGPGNGEYKGRGDIEKRWQAFVDKKHAGPRTTVGTIFALAEKHGWKGEVLERPLCELPAYEPPAPASGATNGHSIFPPAPPQAVFPDTDRKGRPRPTCTNARVAIEALGITCEHDLFHDKLRVGGQAVAEWAGDLTDNTVHMLRLFIHGAFGFDPGSVNTHDAAVQQCLRGAFDPVKNYVESLQWDGVKRLDRWMVRYLGAEDNAFNRAVGRLSLMAAVRRVKVPGFKFDQIIVLEGPEGRGKSSAIEILAGRENFSDQTVLSLDDRAQQEAVAGVWLFEIADLAGHGRAEIERVKAFASRTYDRARPAYGRSRVDRPRRCVFFATTNDSTYLKSQTGNRRFWPILCGRIDLEGLARDRDQLWAEAAREEKGARLTLDEGLWGEAAKIQESRRDHDPWDDLLSGDLGSFVFPTKHGYERRMMNHELFAVHLKMGTERLTDVTAKRAAFVMRRLGWDGPKPLRDKDGVVHRGYTREASATEYNKKPAPLPHVTAGVTEKH